MSETTKFNPAGVGLWSDNKLFDVTAERIAAYAAATNDPIAAHLSGEIAPPVFAVVPIFDILLSQLFAVAPDTIAPFVLHGEQDFTFHRPIKAGDQLTSRGKVIGYAGKASGTVGAVYIETHDANGDLVNEQYVSTFIRGIDAGESVGELAPTHAFDAAAHGLAPVAKTVQHVDEDQTFRYSPASGDPMPIHLDAEFAKSVGLPGIIAHGLCSMAFTSWAALTELGNGHTERLRRLAVRFSKPVIPGQDIESTFFATGSSAGATNYAFETRVGDDVVIKDGLAVIAD
ncbi:MAG TPA: MaoC/PaaZ C-terminal domain-containing protein [Mycobacteriales bacterium]|jgi:acyl dehydratase|nr:MaoC/PaaZ C-terminal domain-containing protein [Mycobacteriales bacterium]